METIINGKKIKLFTLSANPDLADKISKYTNIPLSKANTLKFQDGEVCLSADESVRACHTFIIQPTCRPVNENLMELFIFVDSLKRASVGPISVIMPYYGYCRQDRKDQSRLPITAKLVANLLEKSGIDRLICIDLHVAQIQGFFDIPIDNFSAAAVFAAHMDKKKLKDVIVVSPDHGGAARARNFSKLLKNETPIAIIDKRRPRANVAEILNIIGDVKDKTCILFDDIIDTAGTLVAGAEALRKAGAKEVYAIATHPIFSGNAIEKINKSCLKEVIVADTIPLQPEAKESSKIVQLTMSKMLGKAILNIINDVSVTPVFQKIEE